MWLSPTLGRHKVLGQPKTHMVFMYNSGLRSYSLAFQIPIIVAKCMARDMQVWLFNYMD